MSKLKAQLKKNGNKIFPNPNLVGIDVGNLLSSGSAPSSEYKTYTYTALEDCFFTWNGLYSNGNNGYVSINGVVVNGKTARNDCGGSLIIKKGQVVKIELYHGCYYKVYGLKYI